EPSSMIGRQEFSAEVDRFVEFVKSSRTVDPDGQILMPGDIERMRHQQRTAEGIEVDAVTWGQIYQTASELGVAEEMPQPSP
ncbi:MAG: Ldh family oxidoreductase, partial [Pirellulaceae bacterium]|nr:Ldh family oxidoreductase [Pirellulaceae bacterium]